MVSGGFAVTNTQHSNNELSNITLPERNMIFRLPIAPLDSLMKASSVVVMEFCSPEAHIAIEHSFCRWNKAIVE